MKSKKMTDERVSAQRRKISSEAYGILMLALIISVLVQQFLLNAPLEQYAAEMICFVGISVYMVIRNLTLGLNIYGDNRHPMSVTLVNSIVTGMVVTAVNGVLDYSRYAERYRTDGMGYFYAVLAITFVCSAALAFVVLMIFGGLSRLRQAKIQQKLDADEQSD